MSFSSSRSKRVDTTHTTTPEEYDSFDRQAQFYLYTRPLQDVVLGHADDISLFHWALVVVFKDESVRTLEAANAGGKLAPHFLKECPQDCKGQKYYELIPMETSPYKLREVTVKNSLNGTIYSATSNNCQNWVKAVAKAISSNLATALKNYRTNGELHIGETVGRCSWASSRSSSGQVASVLMRLAERHWSDSTNIEQHKLK